MPSRPYSRVYHEIVDDPMFERVYRNPHALGTWLQMLLTADAMYPTTAPMTSRNPTVRLLIDCGLVIELPGNRYSIRGLKAERERRSAPGRIGAAVRWQSEGNAESMPAKTRRDEKETSNGANAPTNGAATFMGWRGKGLHDGRHGSECSVCHPELSKPTPKLVKS